MSSAPRQAFVEGQRAAAAQGIHRLHEHEIRRPRAITRLRPRGLDVQARQRGEQQRAAEPLAWPDAPPNSRPPAASCGFAGGSGHYTGHDTDPRHRRCRPRQRRTARRSRTRDACCAESRHPRPAPATNIHATIRETGTGDFIARQRSGTFPESRSESQALTVSFRHGMGLACQKPDTSLNSPAPVVWNACSRPRAG